jgi:glutamyl-tRNA synthetase
MVRVRFAPSPTGSLHLGGALSAVANRRLGDWMLLRIDDTDAARTVAGGEEAILRDLEWLGIGWDEGPVRQSERQDLYRGAAERLGVDRFEGITLLRQDGSATYHLASVVDDVEFGITDVLRGNDHRSNERLHQRLTEALGSPAPCYHHHGLLLGPDGKKLSKRHGAASVEDLRAAGVPAEAARAYLEELDVPRHDVRFDPERLRRLSVDAIAALSDEELAERVGIPTRAAPAVRGAHDFEEAGAAAGRILATPEPVAVASPETLDRFRELLERADGELDREGAKAILRELKAVGGDLRELRRALTGSDRGPELWAVLLALPRDEALRRAEASRHAQRS